MLLNIYILLLINVPKSQAVKRRLFFGCCSLRTENESEDDFEPKEKRNISAKKKITGHKKPTKKATKKRASFKPTIPKTTYAVEKALKSGVPKCLLYSDSDSE